MQKQVAMPEARVQSGVSAPGSLPFPARLRLQHWVHRAWRPAATLLAGLMALMLTWHVINGKDGLSAWQKKRAEERQFQHEIQRLQQENTQLRDRIHHLQSDPDAIQHEAREELHYAKPGEVIYTLPAPPSSQAQSSGSGK
jgi:cell division protein FtsB